MKEAELMQGNLLININNPGSFSVKRRWDDNAHSMAPWPGVAFPRRHATPIPVGGAAAVIMTPTPPRYIPGAPAAPEGAPATQTASEISVQEKLGLLRAASAIIGEGITKIYGKAILIGLAAADICIWAGRPGIPTYFEANIINWTGWCQLPGFFKGLSSVLDGASDVVKGSSQAFGVLGGSRVFHAIHSYLPSTSNTVQKSEKSRARAAYAVSPQQGISTVLNYQIITRSHVDSVLIVQDTNESRRSPKKVLPRIHFIKTLQELKHVIRKFKKGEPVHLIDVSEEEVSLSLALDFWKLLLEEGATALLRRDSNICRMSKSAYSLVEEKKRLESELGTLNNRLDGLKHSVILVSHMLEPREYKAEVGKADRTQEEH